MRKQKGAWAEMAQSNREREAPLQRYEHVAKHIIELLKPSLIASNRLRQSSRAYGNIPEP